MAPRNALKAVVISNVALVLEVLAYRWMTVRGVQSGRSIQFAETLIVLTMATSTLAAVAGLYEEQRKQWAVIAGGYAALIGILVIRLTT